MGVCSLVYCTASAYISDEREVTPKIMSLLVTIYNTTKVVASESESVNKVDIDIVLNASHLFALNEKRILHQIYVS